MRLGILQAMAWKHLHVNINGLCRSLLVGVFCLVLTILVAIIIDVEPIFHIIRLNVDLTRISVFSILAFIFLLGYLLLVFFCAIEMFTPLFWVAFNVNLIGFWLRYEAPRAWTIIGKLVELKNCNFETA